MLKSQIRLAVKERLTISVSNNPEVVIRVNCTVESYEAIFGAHSKHAVTIEELTPHLNAGWHERIVNEDFDFTHVLPKGMWVYLSKSRPLKEYIEHDDGSLVELHTGRGHFMVLRFVRSYGTRAQWNGRHGAIMNTD